MISAVKYLFFCDTAANHSHGQLGVVGFIFQHVVRVFLLLSFFKKIFFFYTLSLLSFNKINEVVTIFRLFV